MNIVYDPIQAIRPLGIPDLVVYLGMSREKIRTLASNHPVWKKYFWMNGNEYMTSAGNLLLCQQELAGLKEEEA